MMDQILPFKELVREASHNAAQGNPGVDALNYAFDKQRDRGIVPDPNDEEMYLVLSGFQAGYEFALLQQTLQ